MSSRTQTSRSAKKSDVTSKSEALGGVGLSEQQLQGLPPAWRDRLTDLPTLSSVSMKISLLINDPRSSSRQIAALLKGDLALTAKILRLVNSSYYAVPGGVSDVQRALVFLGFNTVAQLVLSVSVLGAFSGIQSPVSLDVFWEHSLATAVISARLSASLQGELAGGGDRVGQSGDGGKGYFNYRPEEAFTAGLLHDLGKLALLKLDAELFGRIWCEARQRKVPFDECVLKEAAPAHDLLGEALARSWSLPEGIVRAVAGHHREEVVTAGLAERPSLASCVGLANRLAKHWHLGESGSFDPPQIEDSELRAFGRSKEHLEEFREEVRVELEKARVFLNAGP